MIRDYVIAFVIRKCDTWRFPGFGRRIFLRKVSFFPFFHFLVRNDCERLGFLYWVSSRCWWAAKEGKVSPTFFSLIPFCRNKTRLEDFLRKHVLFCFDHFHFDQNKHRLWNQNNPRKGECPSAGNAIYHISTQLKEWWAQTEFRMQEGYRWKTDTWLSTKGRDIYRLSTLTHCSKWNKSKFLPKKITFSKEQHFTILQEVSCKFNFFLNLKQCMLMCKYFW